MKRATRSRGVASFPAATTEPTARAVSRVRRHAEQLAREADYYVRSVDELRNQIQRQRDSLPLHNEMRAALTAALSLSDGDFCDLFLATTYPNPERLGCPSHETLVALALRDDQTEQEWDHILECFPCIVEGRWICEAQRSHPA